MMKLLRMMSLLLVVLLVTSVGQAALVAHWTFDETSGAALDSSGNGFHGTIVGTVTQGQTGKIGGAYLFSGAGWVDFGGGMFTTKITNFPITISYWINSTATTGTRCAVWMGKRLTDTQYLQTGMKNGNANAAYRNTEFDLAAAWKDRGTTATEANGVWHHIVAVYPDTTKRHVYVDGVFADSMTYTQAYYTGTNQVAVGNNNRRTSLTDPFIGLIDDVQIWNETLGAEAISDIYAAGLGDVATNPLPRGNSVDPAVTTALTWVAPAKYTPEVGYNLVLRKATQASEPNFAASDNVIKITNATAVSPTAVSLDYDATYYWKVDSFEPNGIANNAADDFLHPGVVWSFTTQPSVPVITVQPYGVAKAPGETAVFTLEFTSVSPLTSAVWEQLANGSEATWVAARGTAVINENSVPKTVTLTIPGVAVADEGRYRCTITNNGGVTNIISDGTAGLAVKRQLAHYAFEGNVNDTNDGGGIKNDGIAAFSGGSSVTPDITYAPTGLTGLGNGVVFNASTLQTDPNQSFIQLPITAYPNANVGGGLAAGTISCWVKAKSPGTILGVFNDGLLTAFELSVYTATSARTFKRNQGSNQNSETISAPHLTDSDAWYFVASSWGDADGKLRTYVARATENGYLEDVVNDIPANYIAWQYAPAIGASNSRGTFNNFLRAGSMLDDLKIYNYALTPEEIAAEFNAVTGNTLCIALTFAGDYYDTNGDCVVDLADFADFAEAWLATGLYHP
jgi:hypothetical protein